MKKIIGGLLIALTLVFIYPLNVSAKDYTPSNNNLYNSYDYVIDKYDVNIKVNENNTFDITETIDAYFNKSMDSYSCNFKKSVILTKSVKPHKTP